LELSIETNLRLEMFLWLAMLSDFLHKKIDINKYGVIYAGAQKILGLPEL